MTSHLRRRLTPILVASCFACGPTSPPPQAPASGSAVAVSRAAPVRASRAERRALSAKALLALNRGDYASCASLYEAASDLYMAASCLSLGGNLDAALAKLALAIDGGYRDLRRLDSDVSFAALHGDLRWVTERSRLVVKIAEDAKRTNPELLRIYKEDQADRVGSFEAIDRSKVGARDQLRRTQVDKILSAGGAKVSIDFFHAAMVYQHGDSVAEFQRAHELALKAVELDPENNAARWLAAAAEDRKLMNENKPQKWGTQSHQVDGLWVVWEVDPTITNEQRAEWNVPPLAPAKARERQVNQH